MSKLFVLVFLASLIWFFVSKRKDKKSFGKVQKKTWYLLAVSFVSLILVSVTAPKAENTSNKTQMETSSSSSTSNKSVDNSSSEIEQSSSSSAKSSSNDKRKNFYELDKVVKDVGTIGTTTMTYEDYENLVVDKFTLEGAIAKFGLPSHVIGAQKGDTVMEVTFPTNEDGYSADLTFKKKNVSFGTWVLSKKQSVKTDGIGFSAYTAPN